MNRSKLTPCRQMGIPRKKIVTIQKVVESPNSLNISCTSPLSSVVSSENPSESESSRKLPSLNNSTPFRHLEKHRKRKISIFNEAPTVDKDEKLKENLVESFIEIPEKKVDLSEEVCLPSSNPESQKLNSLENELVKVHYVKKKEKISNVGIKDEFDDFQSFKKRKIIKKTHSDTPVMSNVNKPIRRTLTDITELDNCYVNLLRIDFQEEKSNKKLKPITSYHSSDDDFEDQTMKKMKKNKENQKKNIENLEMKLKNRMSHLDDLKRAKLLRSKHPINELKESIEKWRNGCKNALNDLLKHMHGTYSEGMDIEMLMKKLEIPSDILPMSQ